MRSFGFTHTRLPASLREHHGDPYLEVCGFQVQGRARILGVEGQGSSRCVCRGAPEGAHCGARKRRGATGATFAGAEQGSTDAMV